MIKKISAIILALVLCLSVMVVPVSAAVELGDAKIAISLEFDKESYSAGETAYLSVYVDAADDLSLYTGGFVIGVNSAIISPDDNTQDYLRENSTMSETFNSYYKDPSTQFAWLAATVVPKLQAANTAEENALYDQYIKFNAGKNTGGWHENTGTTKAGFNGSDFDPEEAILVIPLIIADGVADGTELKVGITSGSTVCSPVQTSWKYYTTPGEATKTANIAATDFNLSQATVTATIGEAAPACDHADDKITWEVTTEATCTAEGVETGTCSCGEYTTTRAIEKKAHTPAAAVEENKKNSTCTVAGSYDSVVYCSVCNTEISRETKALELAAHTEGAVVVENEKAATCTAEGSYDNVVYCTVCNAELSRNTVTVDKIAHAYDAVVTAPTCTAKGYTTYTCTACGDSYVADEVDALGHTEETLVAVAPTCTETGLTEGKTCSVCGEILVAQTEVPATGHSYNAVVTPPTQSDRGYTTYTCSVCGDSYVGDYVNALGYADRFSIRTPTITRIRYGDTIVLHPKHKFLMKNITQRNKERQH